MAAVSVKRSIRPTMTSGRATVFPSSHELYSHYDQDIYCDAVAIPVSAILLSVITLIYEKRKVVKKLFFASHEYVP